MQKKPSSKRPITSYEAGSQEKHPEGVKTQRTQVKISEFNMDDFLIDSYCSKTTKSIIVEENSPEAILIETKKPVELEKKSSTQSLNSFNKIKQLGKGKYGEVFLVQ